MQSEQHMIYRLTASGGQGGPSKHGRNRQRKTAVSGSSLLRCRIYGTTESVMVAYSHKYAKV